MRAGVGFSGGGVGSSGGGVRAGGGFSGDGVGFSGGGGAELLESGAGDSERGFSGGLLLFVVVMDTLPVVELKVERLIGGEG